MTDHELLKKLADKSGINLRGYEWVNTPFYTGFCKRNFCEEGFELQSSYWNPLDSSTDFLHAIIKIKGLDIDAATFRRNVIFDALCDTGLPQ